MRLCRKLCIKHQPLLHQIALLNPHPRKLLTHVGVTPPPSPNKCVCNCICVYGYTLLWRCWHADLDLQANQHSLWLHGPIWQITCEGNQDLPLDLLRSKLSSLEDGKWSCYMPQMGGSLWQ